jgi:hypothetical protein
VPDYTSELINVRLKTQLTLTNAVKIHRSLLAKRVPSSPIR